jgi:hypothetical protein
MKYSFKQQCLTLGFCSLGKHTKVTAGGVVMSDIYSSDEALRGGVFQA